MCGSGYHLGPFTHVIRKQAGGAMVRDGMSCQACNNALTRDDCVKNERLLNTVCELMASGLLKGATEPPKAPKEKR